MVVTVGDDQAALGIEHEGVRRPELAGPGSHFADSSEELAFLVEDGDAPDQIRICHVRMALCHVNVTIPRVGHDVSRVSQWLRGGFPLTAGFPSVRRTVRLLG